MMTQRVIVVEDDASHLVAAEKVLHIHNYEATCCATAEEALNKLQDESFGILITDLQMPGMDGLELIREARRINSKISTILVTGLATEEVKLKAKGERGNGFFPKPIEWDELIDFVDAFTQEKRGGKVT
jgi:two-component system C4-dicarboxylate transport response regulator DctD